MKVLRSLLTTFIILFQAGLLYSQDTISLNTIIEKTQKLIQQYPTEKVYLHFDKPYYAIGDTIWFKGYLATEADQPSDLSKVLYVDILSDKDTLVRSLKLPVINTSAYGSLTLDPLVYKAGNYRVRAYTYWMINGDDSYFFYKNIRLGNAIDRKIITNISLKGEDADKSPKITANIIYKDPEGNPFANKKVNWKVISKFETIARGKETTDAQGAVSLVLSAGQKAALDTGVLETVLEASDDKQIITNFPLKNSFSEADIQFFPEGGDLIENINGKVAFKAVQEKGLGISVKGEISDNSGNIITAFQSQHLGMGTFSLMPEPGKTYKANLTFSNGIKKAVPLPAVKSSGINLSANNTNATNLLVQISANPQYYSANQNKNYYIVGRSKGIICYAAQAKLNAPLFATSIPRNKFPAGIVQLTLFSASGEPLTERLVFVNHPEALTLSVGTDKKTYGIRQAVKMNVSAKTSNSPVEGNFSVAVVNESKVPFNEDHETTILSSFLLSSELKGYIENPNYYFNQKEKKLLDLDLLMLTQGYRKFSYQEILANKEPVINFLPEQGMVFTGTLRTSNGMPVSKGSLKLVVPQNRFYAETKTNVKGEFKFENVIVPDSSEVSISARSTAAERNMMILLDGSAFPSIKKNINSPDEILNIDSILDPYLQNSQKQYRMTSQMLQEVVIRATAIAKPSHADYPALSGLSPQPDHLIQSDRFVGCNVMLNCLQTSATGLTFAENNFFVTRVYNSGLKVPVQIFFNGMPVDVSYLNNIVPSDVESVEVFLKDDLGIVSRTYGTNGILVINSKKTAKTPVTAEALKKLFPPNNVLTFNPLGYLKSREFYSPKYISQASRAAGSDLRTTVYWNPRVFTDKTGSMSFDFYNGDNKGTYKATVEGTDIDGNLVRTIYRYKVE